MPDSRIARVRIRMRRTFWSVSRASNGYGTSVRSSTRSTTFSVVTFSASAS
jgi:hypothetical protein